MCVTILLFYDFHLFQFVCSFFPIPAFPPSIDSVWRKTFEKALADRNGLLAPVYVPFWPSSLNKCLMAHNIYLLHFLLIFFIFDLFSMGFWVPVNWHFSTIIHFVLFFYHVIIFSFLSVSIITCMIIWWLLFVMIVSFYFHFGVSLWRQI